MPMKTVSVTTILKTVTSSCDFDDVNWYEGETEDDRRTAFWIDVIETKANDSGFIRLVESIIENGWSEGSTVGWHENGDHASIQEGHHRLVAAILFCMDEVPVTNWGSGDGLGISAHEDGWGDYSDNFLVAPLR